MANTRVTSSFITREFLSVLHSSLSVTRNLDHSWNSLFGKSIGPVGKSGATVAIRKPVLGTIRSTWAMDQGDVTESSVSLTIDQIAGVDLNFSDADMALSIEDFSKRYIVPNAQKMAAYIDRTNALYMAQNTANAIDSAGTSPAAASVFLNAKRKLEEALSPAGGTLNSVITPQTEATMVGTLAGQYNPQPYISKMFEEGQMPNSQALGLDWYMSQVLPTITCGSRTNTTPVVAGYTSTTITVSGGTTSGTYKKGDVFTVGTLGAGVLDVNFETKDSYKVLKQFVVTADATASGGAVTLSVSPTIVTSGSNQNVSRAPVNGYALTFVGTASTAYENNLVFHPESFAVAFADLELPKGMDMAEVVSSDGISIRFIRGYDIVNARFLSRMDAFWGIAATRPEWCCRIIGA